MLTSTQLAELMKLTHRLKSAQDDRRLFMGYENVTKKLDKDIEELTKNVNNFISECCALNAEEKMK